MLGLTFIKKLIVDNSDLKNYDLEKGNKTTPENDYNYDNQQLISKFQDNYNYNTSVFVDIL